jgi:hypothetical protein
MITYCCALQTGINTVSIRVIAGHKDDFELITRKN